jgi:hypothetical protein
VDENGAGHTEGNSKRCGDCGLEYFPYVRRGEVDDRIDKLFGLDVVSTLNIVMELLHTSHDRPAASAGAFAAWNWLAGLRQMAGPDQDSARAWAKQIAQLRAQLLEFTHLAARQESLETQLVINGGQTPVIRTRRSLELAKDLATELYALEHIWKKPSRARKPSKHLLGMLELRLLRAGFSEREIALANFDAWLSESHSEKALATAIDHVKKRIKAAEKQPAVESEPGRLSDAPAEPS